MLKIVYVALIFLPIPANCQDLENSPKLCKITASGHTTAATPLCVLHCTKAKPSLARRSVLPRPHHQRRRWLMRCVNSCFMKPPIEKLSKEKKTLIIFEKVCHFFTSRWRKNASHEIRWAKLPPKPQTHCSCEAFKLQHYNAEGRHKQPSSLRLA